MHTTPAATRFTDVAIDPGAEEGERYRVARVAGFPADPSLNMKRYPGRTIQDLTFTNVFVGGSAAWHPDDSAHVDWALPAALEDPQLNNVLAQHFPDGEPAVA